MGQNPNDLGVRRELFKVQPVKHTNILAVACFTQEKGYKHKYDMNLSSLARSLMNSEQHIIVNTVQSEYILNNSLSSLAE